MTSEEKYKAFLQHLSFAEASEEYARILRNSNNTEEVGEARKELVKLINGAISPGTVTEATPDSELFGYIGKSRKIWELKSLAEFLDDPCGVLYAARKKADDDAQLDFDRAEEVTGTPDRFNDFARKFLDVTPLKTGNAKYDAVVPHHAMYKGLVDAVRSYHASGEINPETHIEFTQRTVEIIAEDTKARLLDGGYLERVFDANEAEDRIEMDDLLDDINDLAEYVARSYLNTTPENALLKANIVAQEIRKRVEKMLPLEERADYTEAMLCAAIEDADRTFELDRREGRKKYGKVMRDLYEVVR